MGNLDHADAFFLITSVAVVVVTILISIAVIKLVQMLGQIQEIVHLAKEEVSLASKYLESKEKERGKGVALVGILAQAAVHIFGMVDKKPRNKRHSK